MKSRQSTKWTWHTAQKGHLLDPRKGLQMAELTAWKDKRDPREPKGHFAWWISCMDIVIVLKGLLHTCIPPFGHQTDKMKVPKELQFPQESHAGRNRTKLLKPPGREGKRFHTTLTPYETTATGETGAETKINQWWAGPHLTMTAEWCTHREAQRWTLGSSWGWGGENPLDPCPTLVNGATLKSKNKNRKLLFCILILLICLTGLLSIDSWLSLVQ